jgi:RNA polymerase sigma-70 factor (ECF subfamily)
MHKASMLHASTPVPAETSREPSAHRRLATLLEQHYRHVWRCLRGFGVPLDHVDDVSQQVFIIASTKIHEIAEGKERSFLTGTAVRLAANLRRVQGRCREQPDAEAGHDTESEMPSPEALLQRKQLRQLLDVALDSLPDELRAVFVIVELEGATRAEATEVLDLPAGTVASRLRRGRELFQRTANELREGAIRR